MKEITRFLKNRKNLTNLLVVLILILGVPIATALIRSQQILQSRASAPAIQFVGNNVFNGTSGLPAIDIPTSGNASVAIELTSTLGPAGASPSPSSSPSPSVSASPSPSASRTSMNTSQNYTLANLVKDAKNTVIPPAYATGNNSIANCQAGQRVDPGISYANSDQWIVNSCSHCNTNSDCQQNTNDACFISSSTSNWCFGFADGSTGCLEYEHFDGSGNETHSGSSCSGTGTQGTNGPAPNNCSDSHYQGSGGASACQECVVGNLDCGTFVYITNNGKTTDNDIYNTQCSLDPNKCNNIKASNCANVCGYTPSPPPTATPTPTPTPSPVSVSMAPAMCGQAAQPWSNIDTALLGAGVTNTNLLDHSTTEEALYIQHFCPTSSPSPTASPTTGPTATPNPGVTTLSYQMSENILNIDNATKQPYTRDPVILNYTFADQTPGVKTIFVRFYSSDGKNSGILQQSIQLVPPTPQISGIACNVDITGSGISFTLNGSGFGPDSGSVSVNGSNMSVTNWSDSSVSGDVPGLSSSTTAVLAATLTRKSDNQTVVSKPCKVGVSQVVLNLAPVCQSLSGSQTISNVDFEALENKVGGQSIHQKVSIDSLGEIQGLSTALSPGTNYLLSVKAPGSLRKTINVTASTGTTVADFTLPVGDIFPLGGGDDHINSLDYAELRREWGSTSTSSQLRPGDLNGDGVVNSVDYSCMRLFFNQQSDSLPTPTSASPSPSPSSSPSSSPTSSPTPTPSPGH